ncbi:MULTISPECIES: GH36-type glycosyl hydrolase domain-containing protein [unclassified Lacrimispora]|uniref:GH36-type glycosyl hydrolase domain-containing protein n=1 Tax=unclassified Lacrimispora TaxID=2719232 RepID=UPI00376FCDED
MDTAYAPTTEEKETENYEFFNGFGAFACEGREYEILLEGNNRPPAPWINVVSNKNFGFQISESGAGFTWSINSRENKLTPWSNDPVSDRASEAIYILDEISGEVMTPMSLGRSDRGTYRVRHGFGYSRFLHEEAQISQELTVFTPLDESLKLWSLTLTNRSDRVKYVSLTYYVEWVLGTQGEQTNPYILTSYNNEHECLFAKNIYTMNFQNTYSYLFSSETIIGYTGDRQEFLGQKGSVREPRGAEVKLSCNTGVSYDPCGAIQVSVAIQPQECKTVLFGLGQSTSLEEIYRIKNKYREITASEKELDRVRTYWDGLLGTVKVKTKDRAVDILVNGWLLYQTVSCRIQARAGFYQCGGAYGYRDQLQDTLSLLFADSSILRGQILIACSRQFEEGDVQHWWHPPMGIGVRTRITDDLLWLPYCTAAYIRSTGDTTILKEKVPYIKGPVLQEGQHDVMFTPEISQSFATVYEHCKKAIDRTSFGEHGLPLMGGGDWNDGMNEVGIEGKGESVWLAWFFYTVLGDFIPLCHKEDDEAYGRELEQKRESLLQSIEEHTWDGEWYLRAFYDDGSKLGSKENDECRIDSISQSWSVISKGAKEERAKTAMQSAWRYLVREEEAISLLLTPPFNKTSKNPGYIKNYIPGMRENGGQYTHAAVWLAIATSMLRDYHMAQTLFTILNPIHVTQTRKDVLRYEKEPYVMTADISLSPPYTGRGGWSWYTGSAGWMYQGLLSWFLGIRKEGNELIIDPATPASFGDFSVEYKFGRSLYEIRVESRSKGTLTTEAITVDDSLIQGNRVSLVDDGEKHLIIV